MTPTTRIIAAVLASQLEHLSRYLLEAVEQSREGTIDAAEVARRLRLVGQGLLMLAGEVENG